MSLLRNSGANGVQQNKTMQGRKCSFCGLNTGHYVTVYPKGDDHQQNTNGPMFTEYKMNSLARRDILIVKIKKVLPITKRFEIPLDGIYGELLKNTHVLQEM